MTNEWQGEKKNYETCKHAAHLKINMKMPELRYSCTIIKMNSSCELMHTRIVIRAYFEYSFFLPLFV